VIAKCPVCAGTGKVYKEQGDVVGIMTVCEECGGTGLIEVEED